ncbi:MAG TPA: GDSL-type esterase/lipase family protein, partial [Pyrinomonadaceae bacterium]
MTNRRKISRHLPALLLTFTLLATAALPQRPAAAAEQWSYTALGDSLGYGLFDFQASGYVPRYSDYVRRDTGNNVSLTNLSQNGWTSTQLLNALRTEASFRNAVAASQVVTWDIGGNDFLHLMDDYQGGRCGGADNQDCARSALATFKSNWSAITAEILALRSTSTTVIRTMDIYNPFVNLMKNSDSWRDDGGLNDYQALKPYLDDANNCIAATSLANKIPYARVYQAFNGPNGDQDAGAKGYLAFDGVHPNDIGHKVIADLFRGLGYAKTPSNRIDDPQLFVTQQYKDFLNRDPDAAGSAYWTNQLTQCGADETCMRDRRIGVADAFFFEAEFQQTGAYIYRVYKAALARRPTYAQFSADRGLVVAGSGLDQSKTSYAQTFVQRAEFLQLYPRTLSASQFVDALINSIKQNSGVDLSSQRAALISLYDGTDAGRAKIVRQLADTQAFVDAEYNRSFVLM